MNKAEIDIIYHAIGIIHSPFSDLRQMPIQPSSDAAKPGRVEIYPPFVEGLKDLDGFSHIILLYHFHAVQEQALSVIPFLDSKSRGIFATRAPTRPNAIGLSVVRILSIVNNILHVDGLDILDGTPLLDIKPYVPEFDHVLDVRLGWLEKSKGKTNEAVSDNRFN